MSSICIDCGLCCDGTLFSRVDLTQEDSVESVVRAGLQMKNAEVGAFTQPCQAFSAGRCAIYDERPHACRSYRCNLRVEHDDGRLPLTQAQHTIADAIAMRDKLRPALERVADASRARSLEQLYVTVLPKLEAKKGALTPLSEEAELLLDIGAMNLLLDRHFRTRLPASGPH